MTCVSYPNSSGNTCSSSGTPTGVVRYSYNQSNQLTSLTDWAGDTLTFTYTDNGQICWVSTYSPSTPTCSSVPYQSGAVTTAYSYDDLGNVSGIKTTTGTGPTNFLNLVVNSRDAGNSITSETPTVGASVMNTDGYGYNQTEQVSSGPIVGSSGSNSYSYLPTGSITADTTGFQSAAYASDGELCWTLAGTSSNACTSPPSGATTYSYSSAGERTATTPSAGNPTSYGWEAESNRLVCVNTDGTTCSTSSPSSTTTVYTYDGSGLRTSYTIGSTTTYYTWGAFGGSPRLLTDGAWDYVYADGATPIEQVATSGSSPTVDLLLSDESSNVRGLVQLTSGTHQDQLVNYTDYDAYGTPITESGGAVETGGLTTPQTSLNANYVGSTPWGFGEGYTDGTRLVYLINRYYDPHTAQFLSIDPLVVNTEQSFAYANDSPVRFTDPQGTNIAVCNRPYIDAPLPAACGIWYSDWYALNYYLSTSTTSRKFVSVGGYTVYGPVYDYVSQHSVSGNALLHEIVVSLYIIQADLYPEWGSEPNWFVNSTYTSNLNDYVSVCDPNDGAGPGTIEAQCLPDPPFNPGTDQTLEYLCTLYQRAGLPLFTGTELNAVEGVEDFSEWIGEAVAEKIIGYALGL